MPTTMLLNGLSATSVRLMLPYLGVWTADVDFDTEAVPLPPIGPAVLTIGTTVLTGLIDPDGSGIFGQKGRARVSGGFGGWHKKLPAQHFTNDAGVPSRSCGWRPVRQRQATTPSEKRSDRPSTSGRPRACSGLIYPGVPTIIPVTVFC